MKKFLVLLLSLGLLLNNASIGQVNRHRAPMKVAITTNIVATAFNPSDKSTEITLTNSNLTATGTGTSGHIGSVRSLISKSSGKWYWEVTVVTQGFSGSSFAIGIADATFNVSAGSGPGTDTHAYVCWDDGGKETNNVFTGGYCSNMVVTSKVGVAMDLDGGTITLYFNGVSQGTMFSGITGTWYAMYYGDVFANSCTFNFGGSAFTYAAPAGYNSGLY